MNRQSATAGLGGARTVVALAAIGAGVATTGVQGIAPALPAIQQQFNLDLGQVALISSVYLFPSIFSALLGGALADRFGTRGVFSLALLVFGAGGIVLLAAHSLPVLLGVRFIQGAAFGTILGVSVSLVASVAPSGPGAARAQSRRTVAMAIAEAIFPVATGLLLALAWFAPFAIHVLALPVGVASWILLPNVRPSRKKPARTMLRSVVTVRGFVSLQSLGVLRFFVKFAIMTYFPILAVNEVGLSPTVVGLTLGLSAALSAISAWLTEHLARRWSSARLVAGCVILASASVAGMGLMPYAPVLIAAMLVFGLQDGVSGVAQNVLVMEMAPRSARSTFSGVTVTLRNIGKFSAPLLFAAAALALPVGASLLALSGVGAFALLATHRLDRVHHPTTGSEAGATTEPPPVQTADDDTGSEFGQENAK